MRGTNAPSQPSRDHVSRSDTFAGTVRGVPGRQNRRRLGKLFGFQAALASYDISLFFCFFSSHAKACSALTPVDVQAIPPGKQGSSATLQSFTGAPWATLLKPLGQVICTPRRSARRCGSQVFPKLTSRNRPCRRGVLPCNGSKRRSCMLLSFRNKYGVGMESNFALVMLRSWGEGGNRTPDPATSCPSQAVFSAAAGVGPSEGRALHRDETRIDILPFHAFPSMLWPRSARTACCQVCVSRRQHWRPRSDSAV